MSDPMGSRYYRASLVAAVSTMVLSLVAVAGSLYMYVFNANNGYFPGNTTLAEGPDGLFTPVMSAQGYQEVLLLCAVCGYAVWMVTAVLLIPGVVKTKPALYTPWLGWSGFLAALCLFGIFHNLAFEYTVTQYVLAEYIVFAITMVFILIFGFMVYADYNSRHVRSKGKI